MNVLILSVYIAEYYQPCVVVVFFSTRCRQQLANQHQARRSWCRHWKVMWLQWRHWHSVQVRCYWCLVAVKAGWISGHYRCLQLLSHLYFVVNFPDTLWELHPRLHWLCNTASLTIILRYVTAFDCLFSWFVSLHLFVFFTLLFVRGSAFLVNKTNSMYVCFSICCMSHCLLNNILLIFT